MTGQRCKAPVSTGGFFVKDMFQRTTTLDYASGVRSTLCRRADKIFSPDAVPKPARLHLPRCQERLRRGVSLCNLGLVLQPRFSLFRIGRLWLSGIGWLHLRKCLPLLRLDRDIGGRRRGWDAGLIACDL